ncbi:nuclear transport factor 2 family protein [Flavobacterium zepuense]|uniref:Nuclear transport factor 2 family protein n=1 Tax=Flavobacterium zepuense TaxID=2593302 RepID=A0A552V9V1_9FLAO|nr:nuclear transport factor 2 family protein [Flavobacterium zepuense]TRW27248.1 nuclear transport factor 2 family protein [Flavobacterium zepuense]
MNSEAAQVMEDNLNRVWNERYPGNRLKAIEKIYVTDANLYHVGDEVTGYNAINDSVTATLNHLPPDFVFTQLKPVIINNNLGRLIWGAGPKGQPPVATGMDIAHFKDGKIKSLYVFLD